VVLLILSLLCLDKEIKNILAVWAVVYFIDVFIGSAISQIYPIYFIQSLVNCLVITSVTLMMLSTQWEKALGIMVLSFTDMFFSFYELVIGWSDSFYPHLATISWWIIELQVLFLIYNIKFKAPTKR